ncbi:MAG: hypothetical protein JO306_13135 [Gemmatimonadetes bacterium]|nr:hypothetical protein [Gemmatimonadota bacterium]
MSDRYPNKRYLSVITYQTSGSVWSGIRTKEFHWHVTTVRNEWGRLCIYGYEVNTYYERWWGCGNSSRPRYAWVSDLGTAFQQMLALDGTQISTTAAYAMVYLVLPVMVAGGLLVLT